MTNIDDTLQERGTRYGDFSDHAVISQDILDAYQKAPKWVNLSADKKQALRMFADKVARILNGDPEYKDNWHDIAGYAKLAEDRCVESVSPEQDKECPDCKVFYQSAHLCIRNK